MENTLFNMAKLREISNIKPTVEQISIVKEWYEMVKDNQLEKEVENYINFTFKILNKLLGYNESDIAFEHSQGEGRVEFSIKHPNRDNQYLMIIELKGQKTELDKPQKRKGKTNQSPIDQAFYYAIGSKSVQWIVVSNYNETRIYNYYKKRKFISFMAKDLLNTNNLRIFLSLLSREGLIINQIPDKALKETILVDQQFTNIFYQLYHVTRLELIKQLKNNHSLDLNLIIHYAQTILNRVLFIAYAEDSGLLPPEILTSTILAPIKSKDVSNQRTEIWHKLNLLFNDLDVGNEEKEIPNYNGGLFNEDLKYLSLYDLIDVKDVLDSIALNHKFNYKKINLILDNYKTNLNPFFKNLLVIASLNYKNQVPIEILGHVFEQSVIDIERLSEDSIKLPDSTKKKRKKGKKKKEGIYYTPEIVTSEITRNAIIKFLSEKDDVFNTEKLILEYSENIEVLEEKVKKIKILDIACGSGAFLSQATNILADIYEKIYKLKIEKGLYDDSLKKFIDIYGIMIEIVRNNIYGADISKEAIEIAQVSLFLKLAHIKYQLPDLESNFFIGNSIITDNEIAEDSIDWSENTPSKFDVIITNPPYIPTEDMEDNEKEYYLKNYSVYRKYDTSVIFIEKALSLLTQNGILGVITPLTWETGENYFKFRDVIFKNATLIKLINLPFDIFPEAYVDTCIAIFEKKKPKEDDYYLAHQFEKNYRLATLHIEDWEKISIGKIQNHENLSVFMWNHYYTLWDKILVKKDDNNLISLGDITISTQGYHAGKFNNKEIKTVDSDIMFYVKGRANRHFIIIDTKKYVDLSKWENLKKFYTKPKIFIRRIINRQDRLMAFYVEEPLLTTKDYNPFILNEDNEWDKKIDYKYLTAIINSKLFSFLYIGFSAIALKDDFRQTVLKKLRILPIPERDIDTQTGIGEKQIKLNHLYIEFEKLKELTGRTIISKYKENIKSNKTKLYEIHKWEDEDLNKIFKKLKLSETEQILEYIQSKKSRILEIIGKIKMLENSIDDEVYDLYNLTEQERILVGKRFPDKI